MKLSCDDKTVSAIIAHSAKDHKTLVLCAAFVQNNERNRIPGIFHEQFFPNAVCFNGGPVQFSHFIDIAYFHGFTFLADN